MKEIDRFRAPNTAPIPIASGLCCDHFAGDLAVLASSGRGSSRRAGMAAALIQCNGGSGHPTIQGSPISLSLY